LALAVMTLVVLPLVIFRTTFWPFLSALLERSVSLTLPVPLRLTDAVLPANRTVPENLVLALVDTVQAIDLRFAASLQLAVNFGPVALVGAATVAAFGAAAATGAAAGVETYSASDVASAVPAEFVADIL